MKVLKNRAAVLVTGNEPFFDWVRSIRARERLEAVSEDRVTWQTPEIYLIEPLEWSGQFDGAMERYWRDIFEHQLAAWTQDVTLWPDLSRGLFERWFALEFFFEVSDLESGWIRRTSVDS